MRGMRFGTEKVSEGTSIRLINRKIALSSILALVVVAGATTVLTLRQNSHVKAALPAPGGIDSGLITWQKADDGTSSGTSWTDSSGNGNTATGVNTPLLQENIINYNPSMYMDGKRFTYPNSLGVNGTANFSTFFALEPRAGHQRILWGTMSTAGSQHGVSFGVNGEAQTFVGHGGAACTTVATAIPLGQPRTVSVIRSTGNSMTTKQNAGGASTAACTTSFNTQPRSLGARTGSGGTEQMRGHISEVIQYNRTLTATEAQQVDSYLAIKYGFTLNQTSPLDYLASDSSIIWNGTTNTAHNKDVTAIGRDDNSALSQKQSKSENPGAIVTLGNGGTIATTNGGNSNTFSADRSFLFASDDGATTVKSVAVGGTDKDRMGRIWKAQEIGTVGTVRVNIPGSALSGSAPVLIRSTDTTFDSTDEIIPLTATSAGLGANLDLNNDDFFTFASGPIITAPGGVISPVAWQRADDGTASGSLWLDSSGTNNDATQGTAANQPAFVASGVNFNPSLSFDGTNDHMDYASHLGVLGTANFSTFSALQLNIASTRVFSGSSALTPQHLLQLGSDGRLSAGVGGGGGTCGATTSTALPVSRPGIASAIRSNSNSMTVKLNNGGSASGTCTASFNGSARWLGARSSGSEWLGLIPEFAHYSRTTTDEEVQRINSYLAIKYGITLDQTAATNYLASDGVPVWDATAYATYKNNITGIGRDDTSILNQKQSKSVNPSALVTMGNGNTIASTNNANATTFTNDKSFLTFGDDNGVNAWSGSGAPTNRNKLGRTFKAQNINSVGSVKVRVPDNSSSLSTKLPTEAVAVYLLTDPDGDFTDATESLMTLNGTNWEANTTLADGTFFTFATVSNAYRVDVMVVDNLTGEDGDTGTFKLKLGSQPTGPVTITLTSSDTNEGTVPVSITIQPGDWDNFDANVVTITGVNDGPPVADGAVAYTITTDEVTSSDTNFDALAGSDVADVDMFNQNDDAPSINAVVSGSNQTSETGSCATIRFELLSQPSASVTIPLSIDDATEGTLGSVTQIIISPANWDQPQNNQVTVCGVVDGSVDGDILYNLITGDPTSGDLNYDGITADEVADIALVNTNIDTNDDDSDGVDNTEEDAAPNSGDANNDGTPDRTQYFVASFVSDATGNYAVLEIDDSCQINTEGVTAEASQVVADAAYDYPYGLMNFQATCGIAGFTATLRQSYFGVSQANLILRKHDPSPGSYFNVDNPTLEQLTIGGQALTKVTFQIDDGGTLDMNNAADGVIVDPAGLAVLAATTPGSSGNGGTGDDLADTGQSSRLYSSLAAVLILTGAGVAFRRSVLSFARRMRQ
jgi:hypothetical protein